MSRLIATLLISAAAVCSARAADLPLAPPPVEPLPAPMQAFDWSGFYGGLNLGYGWGDFSRHRSTGGHAQGVIGGGQVGANFQWDNFVGGFETDIQGADIEGKTRSNRRTVALRSYIQPFGTARARIGVAFDQLLVYGTGGLAYAGVDNRLRIFNRHDTDDGVQIGWTAGGGLEWALDPHWSIKAEYLFADLGDKRYSFKVAGQRTHERVSYDQHLARVGLNYRF